MLNSVVRYLERSKDCYPSSPAVIDPSGSVTYKELFDAASHVASYILCEVGTVKRPIIIFMNNSLAAVCSFWGVAMSGNIYVPLDRDLPAERVSRIYSILDPVCILWCGDDAINDDYNSVFGETVPIRHYSEIMNYPVSDGVLANTISRIIDVDPLYILFTSGSTGEPKGVTVSHRAVIDFTEEASEAMGFDQADRFLNQAPFYFDASVPDLFCSVRNGAQLHIVPRTFFSFPKKLADYICSEKITQLYWVPSALVTMANLKAVKGDKMSSLKKVMFCGEVMPVKQLNVWRRELKDTAFVNYYGPSEATYACSYYYVEGDYDESDILPIGKASVNTELLIFSDEGRLISEENETGELCIRGSGLALGYYNNPQRTKEVFVPNPAEANYTDIIYKTGDLAHYDHDGYIRYDGRRDHQIKHMGYRIELGEIEANGGSIPGVSSAACTYSQKLDIIILWYVGSVDEQTVLAELKRMMPDYMIPTGIRRLKTMPMNANGKTDRLELGRRMETDESED